MRRILKNIARVVYKIVHKTGKALVPRMILEAIQERRYLFLYEYAFNRKFDNMIARCGSLTVAQVDETMRRYNLPNRWAAAYTFLNNMPSNDYLSEGFYFSQIVPRMNNLKFVKAYSDKNFYDLTPLRDYTPPTVVRKIEGRFFTADYNPITRQAAYDLIHAETGDLVVKPAIESGSGVDVWVGPVAEVVSKLENYDKYRDVIVQRVLKPHAYFKAISPNSFTTVRIMTAFTGARHVALAAALRLGRAHSRVDNQGAGGVAVGVYDDGRLTKIGTDKDMTVFEKHPDTGFIFEGQTIPEYERLKQTCIDLHRYFLHFGIIAWDAGFDEDNRVRIIEINLDQAALGLLQIPLGPLFGGYKDELIKTYNFPKW